ncbi:hypothetical protein SSAG_01064 [Streptomyces sp. Mg1]|nr:hypothetical protein SSAG_01064 [Streptomyces sp. Mg1]
MSESVIATAAHPHVATKGDSAETGRSKAANGHVHSQLHRGPWGTRSLELYKPAQPDRPQPARALATPETLGDSANRP